MASAGACAAAPAERPPIACVPPEVWSWLHESLGVRPHVVARARATLANGDQASADDVAEAMLRSRSAS
jgi:hypothetical protein